MVVMILLTALPFCLMAFFAWNIFVMSDVRRLIDHGVDEKMVDVRHTWWNRFLIWRLKIRVYQRSTEAFKVEGSILGSPWRAIEIGGTRVFYTCKQAEAAAEVAVECVEEWLARKRGLFTSATRVVIRPDRECVQKLVEDDHDQINRLTY